MLGVAFLNSDCMAAATASSVDPGTAILSTQQRVLLTTSRKGCFALLMLTCCVQHARFLDALQHDSHAVPETAPGLLPSGSLVAPNACVRRAAHQHAVAHGLVQRCTLQPTGSSQEEVHTVLADGNTATAAQFGFEAIVQCPENFWQPSIVQDAVEQATRLCKLCESDVVFLLACSRPD